MRRMQQGPFPRLALILAIVCFQGPLPAQEKKTSVDLTGTWQVEVEVMGGTGNPVWTLEQKCVKLTGTYEGLLGKRPMTGSVEGGKIQLEFEADYEGNKFKVAYSGAIGSPNEMKGKVQLGDMGEGTWTAKRKS